MNYLQILILAFVQGLAELLPVSSSAHVIAAAKLMHVKSKPDSPEFTLLLVMLHTGTMFAVIVYFWQAWKRAFFSSREAFIRFFNRVILATAVTGVIGFALKLGIEKYLKHTHPGHDAEIEELFSHLELLAVALAAAGVLILWSGFFSKRQRNGRDNITLGDSISVGAIQGLCLPFRGFSRSGATISLGLLRGMARQRIEEYSFALAVVLTPAIVFLESRRLIHHHTTTTGTPIGIHEFLPSLLGMAMSFLAGLIALKLLSRILEKGQWWVFGVYCLAAAAGVYLMYLKGY
jgi:undecaprenyl-diphosphatase